LERCAFALNKSGNSLGLNKLSMVGHRGDGDGVGRWLGPHPPTTLWKATSDRDVVFLRSVRQQNKNEFMEIIFIINRK
jgi:hypothetical protein